MHLFYIYLVFFFGGGGGGAGRWALIQGWVLINFSYLQGGRLFKVGAYWALNRINTVLRSSHEENKVILIKMENPAKKSHTC